uniref:Uncharacterized protein n=1 Tax=Picea glauca TaxID=3330 RepID=A0A124GMC0_PICGL|nr:hypothetical protein ABT39_MTgene3575 [Picea glauca]
MPCHPGFLVVPPKGLNSQLESLSLVGTAAEQNFSYQERDHTHYLTLHLCVSKHPTYLQT